MFIADKHYFDADGKPLLARGAVISEDAARELGVLPSDESQPREAPGELPTNPPEPPQE